MSGVPRLRAAVVGAGNMGRHHARILQRMSDVDLVAVADTDVDLARRSSPGAAAVPSAAHLPPLDMAVVAVPTHGHLDVAMELLDRGVSLLVEKPLACDPVSAERIVVAARHAGVVLGVGHVERFNPAVAALAEVSTEPLLVQFDRLSPHTPRVSESVVFDLMVHDLDLACHIAGAVPVRVQASGIAVFSDMLDAAGALLTFPSGCVASVHASRVTQDKVRRIAVSERDRFIVADSISHDIRIKRQTVSEYLFDTVSTYREASVTEIPYLDRRVEPLAAQLEEFVGAVRSRLPFSVPGEVGLEAVRLAWEVERQAAGARRASSASGVALEGAGR